MKVCTATIQLSLRLMEWRTTVQAGAGTAGVTAGAAWAEVFMTRRPR
jgi:hypothetical protein